MARLTLVNIMPDEDFSDLDSASESDEDEQMDSIRSGSGGLT